MYLKKIELYGFKSFAEKIELEFKNGITAIVGPNGSGKSNIADAVRWVLGEQSVKSLRGSKMEDVIFSGTQRRKPLGYAEVSLVIDNTLGILPIDFNEVRVTRRVFRSGESEFYINKSSCRLKDIHQLFMDTGLGKEGYSIIGQGRIDDILSVNSQDRRYIFEEAAGIVKYKTRKNEAEKKLEKTDQNLIRIVDIINELEKQIDPLNIQAEKAKKYLLLKENLKEKELALFIHRMDQLQEKHKAISANRENISIEIQEKEKNIQEMDGMNQQRKDHLKNIEDEINNNQNNLYEIKSETEKKESEITLYQERIDNLIENKDRVSREIVDLKEHIQTYSQEIKQKEKDFDELASLNSIQASEFNTEKRKLNDIRDLQRTKEKDLEEKRQLKLEFINHLSELKSSLNGISIMNNNIHKQLDHLHKDSKKLMEDLNIQKTQRQEMENKLINHKNKAAKLDKEKRKIKEELIQLNQQIDQIKESVEKKNREINFCYSRYKILEEMEMDYEGYYRSVKNLMGERKKDKHLHQNIYGVIAELISVPSEYTIAIEMALGASLQNIVVKNEYIAKDCIHILNEKKWGRATFLPLDVIKGYKLSKELEVLKHDKGFIGMAHELIEYPEIYRGIMEHLLGRVAIVENIKDGINLSRKLKHRIKIVTKDGVVFNPGGSMVGGSGTKSSNGILSRQQERIDISKKLEDMNHDLGLLNHRLLSLEKLEGNLLEKQGQIIDGINITEKEMISMSNTCEQITNEEKRIDAQLKNNQDAIQSFDAEIFELKNKKIDLEKEMEKMKGEINSLDEDIIKSYGVHQEDKEKIEGLTTHITHLEIEMARNQQKYLDLENQLNQWRGDIRNTQDDIKNKNQTIDHYHNQIAEYRSEITERKKRITEQMEYIQHLEKEQGVIIQKKAETEEQIRRYEENLKELNMQLVTTNNALHKTEIQLNKMEMEMDNLQNNIFDDYQITYPLALGYKQDINSIQGMNQEIKSLKDQMNRLGNVNIDSIEEYNKVSERYSFLKKQREDLENAQNSLQKIINEMIKTMEKQFEEQFEIIQEKFNMVFEKLFQGGYGKIYLTEPADPLASGVEIEVQPPGKKLQNLSLLSGGERALTAIALLFAILKVKPTPFCILDEIEAALDDPNVYRYANFLKDFSKETQFISVTHRKGTMELADILYGVTMEEQGVSKLVSVKLTELVS